MNFLTLRTAALTSVLCGALALTPAPAQQPETAPAAATRTDALIVKPARTIGFQTDEATWMNIDVSRDGQTLLTDILGDLYTLPVSGGEMKPLTTGMQW